MEDERNHRLFLLRVGEREREREREAERKREREGSCCHILLVRIERVNSGG